MINELKDKLPNTLDFDIGCFLTTYPTPPSHSLSLSVNAVDKHVIEQAFSEMGLSYVHNSGVLSVVETEAVLNKIFQLAQRDRTNFLQPERCTELTLNWVLKCYDRSALSPYFYVVCLSHTSRFLLLSCTLVCKYET